MLHEIRRGLARGWKFTPLKGKVPILKGWQHRDVPDADILAHVQAGGNVGLRTGSASGVIVIDVDTDKGPSRFYVRWATDRAVDYGRRGKVLLDVRAPV